MNHDQAKAEAAPEYNVPEPPEDGAVGVGYVTGIPFSSADELTAPIDEAKALVEHELEVQDKTAENVYVVWFAYILGGWKALLSTTIPDGRYYEVTHNAQKSETYVDTYLKVMNNTYTRSQPEPEDDLEDLKDL